MTATIVLGTNKNVTWFETLSDHIIYILELVKKHQNHQ